MNNNLITLVSLYLLYDVYSARIISYPYNSTITNVQTNVYWFLLYNCNIDHLHFEASIQKKTRFFSGIFLSSGSLSMIIIKGYNKVVFEGCGKQNKGEDVNQKLSIFKKNIGGKHRQLRILLSACLRHPFLNFASISTLEDK